MNISNESDKLKIETISMPNGNEVSFCPERGGIITSLKFRGKEILYMEEDTFNNRAASVHGGIPILFPNAGPVQSPNFPDLKEHGFARTSHTWEARTSRDGFEETLISDEEKYKSYPFNFRFTFGGKFEEDDSFTINERVENLEDEKALPLSIGLHPYFRVPRDKKNDVKFNFEGGKFVEEQINLWANGEYICIDSPKMKDPSAVVEVIIPDLGTLIINPSEKYKKIWVWSQPGKDFVCIEPMMRDKGGLTSDPEKVGPKETLSLLVNYSLK